MAKDKIEISKIINFLGDTKVDKNAILERKSYDTPMVLQEGEEQTFIAKISSENIDRDGDVLIASGCDFTTFNTNPVCMFNHSYTIPMVGKVLATQVNQNSIYAKIKLADTNLAKDLWSLVKGGFLRTCSVGYIVKESLVKGTRAFNKYCEDRGIDITDNLKRIITKWELLENSLVPLPANPDALVVAISTKAIHLDDKLIKQLGISIKEIEQIDKVEEVKVEQIEDTNKQGDGVTVTETVNTTPSVSQDETPKPEQTVTEQPLTKDEELPKEPPVELPKEELAKVVETVWTVIRDGGYLLTEEDSKIVKSITKGKVL